MPIVSDTQQYQLIRADGTVILKGGFSRLMEAIPQSVARLDAEQAILAAKVAKAREDRLQARSDSLDAREDAVAAREQQAFSDQIRAFADSVMEIGRRLDALERARNEAELARLPDPDSPTKDDYLPPAVLKAPNEEDRELPEAEEVLGDELQMRHAEPDQDPGQIPATPASVPAIMGERFEGGRLPEGTSFPLKSDGFVCARDRKAYRRRMLANGV
jgi:hypothetical protein